MTLTQLPEIPWRFQLDPVYSGASIVSAPITQFYQSSVVDGSGNLIAVVPSNPSALTVDLVAKGGTTVTFNSQSYSYLQAIGLMQAILAQERATQLFLASGGSGIT